MQKTFTNLIIVSGGQTGVDRAALDFALVNGIACGGFCTKGRRAEDGKIPAKYPLTELPSYAYNHRTRTNAEQSDGTLIISTLPLTGGTQFTLDCVKRANKPVLVLHPMTENPGSVFTEWIHQNKIQVVNFAGPRESTEPGIYQKTLDLLAKMVD